MVNFNIGKITKKIKFRRHGWQWLTLCSTKPNGVVDGFSWHFGPTQVQNCPVVPFISQFIICMLHLVTCIIRFDQSWSMLVKSPASVSAMSPKRAVIWKFEDKQSRQTASFDGIHELYVPETSKFDLFAKYNKLNFHCVALSTMRSHAVYRKPRDECHSQLHSFMSFSYLGLWYPMLWHPNDGYSILWQFNREKLGALRPFGQTHVSHVRLLCVAQ